MPAKKLEGEKLEAAVQEVLALLRSGKTMRGEHRYNLESHLWGYDPAKNDYYHRVEVLAEGGTTRIRYGEQEVREWLVHWLQLQGLDGLKKEQGWD